MNTTYFLNLIAGNIFQTKADLTIPNRLYIGLSTTAPNLDGTGVSEPDASAAYGRVELTSLTEPTDGVVANESDINFPESTASWGSVTHFVIYDTDAVASGNLLMYGLLSTPNSVEAETVMTIEKGHLKLSVQNPATA